MSRNLILLSEKRKQAVTWFADAYAIATPGRYFHVSMGDDE